MNEPYIVKPGDTLGAIAKRFNTNVDELAKCNNVRDKNKIAVGQPLQIPAQPLPDSAPGSSESADEPAGWAETWLRFIDALERPIVGLKVRLLGGDSEVVGHTDGQGRAPLVRSAKPNQAIDIFVEKHTARGHGEKKVATYTPTAGAQTVRVQSGLHVHRVDLRTHDGVPASPPKTMRRQEPASRVETRDLKGNPLTCILGDECPNPDDLKLGANNVYRDWVKKAAARAGLLPQAVAAVMNAEAAKGKDGKWQEDSKSGKSSATGMTQFLDASWIDMALQSGTYLNDKAVGEGWLSTDEHGVQQFKKADGTFIKADKQHRLDRALVRMIKPKRTASDANLQKLLDLRYQAEYAIMTAMDYAKANLAALRQRGYDIDSLNDVEKARIMYLCHHLGIGDAVHFIQNTIPEEDVYVEGKDKQKHLKQNGAKKLLTAQVGPDQAENKYKKENGSSWVKGHRAWLRGFININIAPVIFTCPGGLFEQMQRDQKDADLAETVEALKK